MIFLLDFIIHWFFYLSLTSFFKYRKLSTLEGRAEFGEKVGFPKGVLHFMIHPLN